MIRHPPLTTDVKTKLKEGIQKYIDYSSKVSELIDLKETILGPNTRNNSSSSILYGANKDVTEEAIRKKFYLKKCSEVEESIKTKVEEVPSNKNQFLLSFFLVGTGTTHLSAYSIYIYLKLLIIE